MKASLYVAAMQLHTVSHKPNKKSYHSWCTNWQSLNINESLAQFIKKTLFGQIEFLTTQYILQECSPA